MTNIQSAFEKAKSQLEKDGYVEVSSSSFNGTDTSIYLHKETLNNISISTSVLDTEVILDLLGIRDTNFKQMCQGKDKDTVLKELIMGFKK